MNNDILDIYLDKFKLRWYQEEIFNAIDDGTHKSIMYIAPRRSGKDVLGWNCAWRQCIKRVCLVFYVLPKFSQARRTVWDAITIDQQHFMEFIPKQLIEGVNKQQMSIRFRNGSILQCIGGQTYDSSIVGANPYGIVVSEYALMPEKLFPFIRPILAANRGWCLLVGTPRGKNHMYHHYNLIKDSPHWKVVLQKTSEINHLHPDVLKREYEEMTKSGDEGLYLQEYECDWFRGIEGSFYGRHLDQLNLNNQITQVPWDPSLLVYTAWDIGVNDPTTIIFFQVVNDGLSIRVIDCYSNNNVGLDHYVKIIQDRPYRYDKHFAPHDIKVREWGGGAVTRFEKARQLNINFTLLDQMPLIEGIENVWSNFPRFWIDDTKCKPLLDALENYRKEWDEKAGMFHPRPVRSWATHYSDAFRYLCQGIYRTQKGKSGEEYDRERYKALYGQRSPIQGLYRDGFTQMR